MINSNNVLCSVGVLIEQGYMQMVTSWRAIYMVLVEIVMFVLQGFGGSLSQNIVLAFPTDQFYSLVCACKDVYAGAVGLGMALMESIVGFVTSGRIDLTVQSTLNPQEALVIIQIRTLGALVFNLIADMTLYPLLALHRWLLCVVNEGLNNNNPGNIVTVHFGDVSMDSSWGTCSPLANDFSVILDPSQMQYAVQNSVDSFVAYTMALLSGIGNTVIYALLLMYDSLIAILLGVVWGIQSIMYAFNPSSCTLTDYNQKLVLQCVCGDTPYSIPKPQRAATLGAFWCYGALSVTLVDGTQGVIFNPYSLDELSQGLAGVTQYIQCLATSPSTTYCKQPPGESTLGVLTRQNVDPIAVWTKCKSNYLLQSWDTGAGALFSNAMMGAGISADVYAQREAAQIWAQGVSPAFLECMASQQLFNLGYGTCMTMYLNLTLNKLPNGYFLYLPQTGASEPPDACLVFSGMAAAAERGSPLQQTMQSCLMDTEEGDPSACPFNPSVWSASAPANVPVAKLFGTLTPQQQSVQDQYQALSRQVRAAFESFNRTFATTAKQLKIELFTADGDFIHDFIDCVFLGPYTRVDMLPCDWEGKLECPFYARDEAGGMTRDFTPCFGDVLHGDEQLPFTCGSQARRAIIKYFIRDYCFRNETLDQEITALLEKRVGQLQANWTSPASYGCLNPSTGRCAPEACNTHNSFAPCLDMDFTVSAADVSQFVLMDLLNQLDPYYTFVMQDTSAWSKYYNESGATAQPAQWGQDPVSANVGVKEAIFRPLEPVLFFDASEVYSMPTASAPAQERVAGSIWSQCMGLLGQGMMSLPVDANQTSARPLGADNSFLASFDLYDVDAVAALIGNITQEAAAKSPFLWHKERRHAPSPSGVCAQGMQQTFGTTSRLRVGPVQFEAQGATYVVQPDEGLSFPFHGFSWGMLGFPFCLCGAPSATVPFQCILAEEACRAPCAADICAREGRTYSLMTEGQGLWECLHQKVNTTQLRCPELALSDSWGLFPVDCTNQECQGAKGWAGNAYQDAAFEGIRFLTEGRMGLKLPNFKFVNETLHQTVNYAAQQKPAQDYSLAQCFSPEDLLQTAYSDSLHDTSVRNFVRGLFPALQLLFDSPVASHCSRFVVESARWQALSLFLPPGAAAVQMAAQQAALWKSKCHAKIRHMASCNRLGVYFEVPPPDSWQQLAQRHCDVPVHPQWNSAEAFITPWCIAVHQGRGLMYDARLCQRGIMTVAEKQNAALGISSKHPLNTTDLVPSCLLLKQPLHLLAMEPPVSTLFTVGAQRLNPAQEPLELSTSLDLATVGMPPSAQEDHVSHVLDWWPADEVMMPVGYHITAPMLASELAPVGLDSHYAMDPFRQTIHYVHSALRNSTLLPKYLGSGGLCRAHSMGMPLWDANTNRICTRLPSALDVPHLPITFPFSVPSLMGPYAAEWLQSHYGPSLCAPTAEDVPWAGVAGSFPNLGNYFQMDPISGDAIYPYAVFPPPDAQMVPLRGLFGEWGPCSATVVWGYSPSCMDNMSALAQCPKNTACLRLTPSSPEGVCFSVEAFRQDSSRSPCFTTEHCSDGWVCLADGGCSPLYLHVWNAEENDISSLEFGVLADDCGFEQGGAQSMRGASAWEQVPDLLFAHGMCSHRSWFAFRNALQEGVCPLAEGNQELMQCNTTQAVWPDIQMHFGGCRTSPTLHPTMSQLNTLQVVPHACDMDYLHAAVDNQTLKRLQVCSGYQGLMVADGAYRVYPLNDKTSTWEGMSMLLESSANATFWMRTYDEPSGLLHVGNLLTGPVYNNTLGFLGGETNGSNPVLAALSAGSAHFFRCADRIACQMPDYTYGGVLKDPRLDLNTRLNFTELSLRRCGSIGALSADATFCRLDAALFPLFSYLLVQGTTSTRGCTVLWPPAQYLSSAWVLPLPPQWEQSPQVFMQTNPQALFCSATPLVCVYAPRPTSVLSDGNAQDAVAGLMQRLNALYLDTTRLVVTLTSSQGALSTYEDINLCSMSLLSYTYVLQPTVQAMYQSPVVSGFYVAFQFYLYEFPQQWFHRCLLNILLSTLDPTVPTPDTSTMVSGAAVPLALWSAMSLMDLCEPQRLLLKSGLHHMVCTQLHAPHTFSAQTIQDPAILVSQVQTAVLETAQAELYDNQQSAVVQCYATASWKNLEAMQQFYSLDANCAAGGFPTPCDNQSLYTFSSVRSVSLQDMIQDGGGFLAGFLTSSTASINQQAPSLSNRVDYVSAVPNATLWDAATALPLGQVWGIDTSLLGGFVDSTEWVNSMCRAAVPEPFCPPLQPTLAGAPNTGCLFTADQQYMDADRYLTVMEPVITVVLGNTAINISICEPPAWDSLLVLQTDWGFKDVDPDTGALIPVIQATLEAWKTFPPSSAINCAWTSLEEEGWWPGAMGSSASYFEDLYLNFGTMPTWSTTSDWQNMGCGNYEAVVALQIRLEGSYFYPQTTSAAYCSLHAGATPVTRHDFAQWAPKCSYDASGVQYRAFRVRDAHDLLPKDMYSFWRCAECTRYQTIAVPALGMFGCTLPGGVPLDNLFTEDMLAKTFPYLYNPEALAALLGSGTIGQETFLNQSTALLILSKLQALGELSQLTYYGGGCTAAAMWDCPSFSDGYDTGLTLQSDQIAWNKAVSNPTVPLTMTCNGQQYTTKNEVNCNPNTDQRRQKLAEFAEAQYRRADGVWLQQVQQGWGVAFEANVAHSSVNLFTLFYASADRPPEQVFASWVLGAGPCASQATTLEDRVCVESSTVASHFEAMHPWVGGDFNPFMGLDECPFQSQTQCLLAPYGNSRDINPQDVSMCSCTCSPAWACAGNTFNYSADFMLKEFPVSPACEIQSLSQVEVMGATDASNLCSIQPVVQQGCATPQGVLGGAPGAPVTTAQLHALQGILLSASSAAPQTLLSSAPLWTGEQGQGFLSMPRHALHPAHVAFGLDSSLTSLPLVVQAISLLPQGRAGPATWARDLPLQWETELTLALSAQQPKSILNLYPQLDPNAKPPAPDWSCPYRKLVFWGSSTPGFGPVTPNPVVASKLYGLGGVHPFILPEGPYAHMADYISSNGICFYRQDASTWPLLDVSDIESPCSLRGMLSLLVTEEEAAVSVQEAFAKRCNDIIDSPDVGGSLRSGETLQPASDLLAECGLLARLTPALVATRGDTAPVAPAPQLNTSSEGGDCHMGRLALVPEGALQGLQCTTVGKNTTGITVFCPFNNQTMHFPRAAPLTLQALVSQRAVVYRSEFQGPQYPVFKGPSLISLQNPEVSFGQLYSPTLKETLSNDLLRLMPQAPTRPWTGEAFFEQYLNGSLVGVAPPSPPPAQAPQMIAMQLEAQAKDNALWNQSDWTWSFLNHSWPQGSVSQKAWLHNRQQACNASMQAYLSANAQQAKLQNAVRRISLCSPPPTSDLSILCTAMTQFATDVTQTNCQLMGADGACITNLGMFYLPYMWSNTNQKYSYDTVTAYYQNILSTYFANESYAGLCSASAANATILQIMSRLSQAQNAICPATSLDMLKTMLSDLRNAGHDLLLLAYNYVMMVANLMAAVFTLVSGESGDYLSTAVQYMLQMLVLVKQIMVMLLDVLLEVLMYISSLGQIFSSIISFLCNAYNWVLANLLSVYWCSVTRPIVIAALQFLQGAITFSSSVSSNIQQLLNLIGSGDVNACIAWCTSAGQMQCPSTANQAYNASQFQPQAMATMCWSQAQGGGVFTGQTASLLTCTSSDTCALDPLLYDDPTGKGLVYCGSCPQDDFGCDTYLQRCVCGAQTSSKTSCLTNADCEQPNAMCSVSSTIDRLRSSYVTVQCSACGSLSMDNNCLMDGQASTGVCGCANVASNLLSCPSSQLGERVLTGFVSQLCPVVTDATQQQMLATTGAIPIDFSNVAIAYCNVGNYDNLCLNIDMPLVLSSGTVQNSYVVLLGLLAGQGTGRRLLSQRAAVGPLLAQRMLAQTPPTACLQVQTRSQVKECLYWAHLGSLVVETFHLADVDGPTLFTPSLGVLSSLRVLLPHLWVDPDLRAFLLLHMRHGRALLETTTAVQTLVGRLSHGRRLQAEPLGNNYTWPEVQDMGDWDVNCSAVQIPLAKITGAFWDTVTYYKQSGSFNQSAICDISQGIAQCIGYTLPPAPSGSSPSVVSEVLLYVPTLGMGGDRVLGAVFSPLTYNEAVRNDYITGQRLLQDMGTCNFTQLTFGPAKPRDFLVIFCAVACAFAIVSYACIPCSCGASLLWYILFPVVLFWCLYNISPLCWPMIPPRLVHDLNTQVSTLIPQQFAVPRYLVRPQCTVSGLLSDGTYDPSCFIRCADAPFLFKSWQDTLAWWLCEASTDGCLQVGQTLDGWQFFQDLVSSTQYYANVIRFSYRDPELVQAHRLCAVFTMYNMVLLGLVIALGCYLAPSVLLALMDVFTGCMVLVWEAYNLPDDNVEA